MTPTGNEELQVAKKRNLLETEIRSWLNGQYLNEILYEAAVRLKEEETAKAIKKELDDSARVVAAYQEEWTALAGDSETVFLPDYETKRQILVQEIERRDDSEYLLGLRGKAARKTGNRKMANEVAEQLSKLIGYRDALKKALKNLKKP